MSRSAALLPAVVIMAVLVVTQTGCFFKKNKLPAAPTVPVQPARIAVLPLSIPPDNADLRWISLGAAVMIAKVAQSSDDLEVMPLWDSIPLTVDTLGTSRSLAPEQAASIASRMAAKWAVCGEVTAAKNGINLLLDFVPARETGIPFRYEKQLDPDSMQGAIREAFEQFLRYLVAKPIPKGELAVPDSDTVRALAEAIDLEYGWQVSAEPGRSEKVVLPLAQSDPRLAAALFNPINYPAINRPPAQEEPPKKAPPVTDSPQVPPATDSSTENSAKPAPSPPESPPSPGVISKSESTPSTAPPTGTEPALLKISAEEIPVQRIQTIYPGATEKPTPVFPFAGRSPTGKPAPGQTSTAPSVSEPPASKPESSGVPAVMPARAGIPGPPRGFVVQVLSSTSKKSADAAVARLREEGLDPAVEQVDLGEKGVWYRIRLQNFSSRAEATAEGERLRSAGLIREYWVVR